MAKSSPRLDRVDLTRTVGAKRYNQRIKKRRTRLLALQRACADAKIPVLVVFEGWDAAGKGTLVHALTSRLDPRGYDVHPIGAPRPFEQTRPWLWRYWMTLPAQGRWGVYDRSWYGRVLVGRMDGLVAEGEAKRAIKEIQGFESTLVAEGAVLVKLFLHISEEEQRQRLETLEADPVTAWRVSAEDWRHHRQYAAWHGTYEAVLGQTHTRVAPWTLIPAHSLRYAHLAATRTLIRALERRLDR